MKTKLPFITSYSRYPEGYCEVNVMARTKADGPVIYHYLVSCGYWLDKILRKKVFNKKDWVLIQKEGRLTHKDILGKDGEVVDTKHYDEN